ncbi:MAG: hypothetical protein QM718_08825 [Steroidobacteraceae bacterium]
MTLAELKETLFRFAEERAGTAPEKRLQLANELADTMLYLVRLSERFGIDLIDASSQRIVSDARNQPKLVTPATGKTQSGDSNS